MPYSSIDGLPPYVRKRSKPEQRRWMSIFNDVFKKTGNEAAAFKAANGALKLAEDEARGVPIVGFASSVFPDWDAAGVYEVQVMRSGAWKHSEYGDVVVTNANLATAVRNFRNSSLKPFLDYNHAITGRAAAPGDQEAIGWMADMWIEDLEGAKLDPEAADKSKDKVLLLKATYEVNAEANEQIKAKKYALFSPTWYDEYMNPETGEEQGLTIVGGAATNIPFFTGMQGFVAIADRSKERLMAMAAILPKATLCVTAPADMESIDAVKALDAMGYKIDSFGPNPYGEDEYRVRTPDGGDMVKMMGALADAGFDVESFCQGWLESQAKIEDEVARKAKEAAAKGETTAVADALAKAAADKKAEDEEAARKKYEDEHRVIDMNDKLSIQAY